MYCIKHGSKSAEGESWLTLQKSTHITNQKTPFNVLEKMQ